MKLNAKPTLVLGAIACLSLISPAAHAQQALLNISGNSVLADAFGVNTGPEALVVAWTVTENASLVYTYTYVINNPAGDVLLNNNGSPTTTPEIVDAFEVGFDTTKTGAYITGTQSGGVFDQNNGTAGLTWAFNAVAAGTSSPILSFESDLPPVLGNANAQDANPPSPWSSFPNGQQIMVPGNVPEPGTVALVLTGLMSLPFARSLRNRK